MTRRRQVSPMVTTCPICGDGHEFASPVADGGKPPVDGDVSFCITCGSFSFFDHAAPGGARMPEIEELHELLKDPQIQRIGRLWREIQEAPASDDKNTSRGSTR